MKILILGAGAWGTALATSAAQRHAVSLWARDPQQAAALQSARENNRYLPGVRLPPSLQVLSAAPRIRDLDRGSGRHPHVDLTEVEDLGHGEELSANG